MFSTSSLLSRRELLRRTGALAVAGPAATGLGLNLAAMGQASAAVGGDYKALVCIFLYGGNDHYNTVLATDSASWDAYSSERGTPTSGIALAAPGTPARANGATLHERLGGALPIAPATAQAGRSFALHPSAGALQTLFNHKRLAVVANVGHMLGPTTKADFVNRTARRPSKLGSHNDQQSVWQSGGTEGTTRGWGGRCMDMLLSGNSNAMFSAISVNGNAVWLPGQATRAYQLAPTGPVRVGAADGSVYGSAAVRARMQAIMQGTRGNRLIEREHAAVSQRSYAAADVLGRCYPAADAGPWGKSDQAALDPLLQFMDPATKTNTYNPLAHQLQAVARTIAVRSQLGMSRQVFFVGLGGWDVHDALQERHATLIAQLAHGMQYFDRTLTAMGVDNQVTTFTMSEFGRALTSNGDGCDHGWGGHHFVMGGAVKGGDIYGRFPTYSSTDGRGQFLSDDLLDNGQLLPSQSVDQYAATLGRWFGVSDSNLAAVLPNLPQWGARRNLGFI